MQTFAHWCFMAFGLRRRTAARRTPAMLQVDRSKVVPLLASYAVKLDRNSHFVGFGFVNHRGPQKPCGFRIGTEIRDGGLQYVKPIADEPRTA